VNLEFKTGIAQLRRALRKSVPEGFRESSPALQCWVPFFRSETSRMGRLTAACPGGAIRNTKSPDFLSSLTGRTCLWHQFPALKCWATFTESLRDASMRSLSAIALLTASCFTIDRQGRINSWFFPLKPTFSRRTHYDRFLRWQKFSLLYLVSDVQNC
jgi:hypothetical protein